MNETYFTRVNKYLRAAFGASPDVESGESTHIVRRAGISNGKPLLPNHAYFNSFYESPALQGPLRIEGRMKKRNMWANGSVPCDISVPSITDDENPVALFLISWSDGVIEQFVMDEEFGPSWLGDSLTCKSPSLVHVETLSLSGHPSGGGGGDAGGRQEAYMMIPDPLTPANFHVIAQSTGLVFLLHLHWMDCNYNNDINKEFDWGESTAHVMYERRGQAISGNVIVSDPLLGHVAIIRSCDGFTESVNLSVVEKMMLLSVNKQVNEKLSPPVYAPRTDLAVFIQTVEKKLVDVQEALQRLTTVEDSATISSDIIKKKALECGRDIVDPLCEVKLGLKFAADVARKVYENQNDILRGNTRESDTVAVSSATVTKSGKGNSSVDQTSLLERYEKAQERHAILKMKLDKIGENIEEQKRKAGSSLSFLKRKYTAITRAEELYSEQLNDWLNAKLRLDVTVSRIKEQLESLPTRSVPDTPEKTPSKLNTRGTLAKKFLSPTKENVYNHVASPHRLSYRSTPQRRAISSTRVSAPPRPTIMLSETEVADCNQLQFETKNICDAVSEMIKILEKKISDLSGPN